MGMSLIQRGSGFPFFAPCVYSYLSGADVCSIAIGRDEIPDPEVAEMLEKVTALNILLIT